MKTKPEEISRLEGELRRIRNVHHASILLDDDGEIRQVDLLSDTRRPPRPIVRDVEAVLRRWGVEIDYRRIGVVQMEDPPGAETGDPPPLRVVSSATSESRPRIQIGAVHTTTSAGSFVAEIELNLGPFEAQPGRAEGPALDPISCVDVVARAALQAVRNLLQPQYEIRLCSVQADRQAGVPLVTVVVDFGRGREFHRLAGTAIEHGSLYETTVYACLDALNRPLERAEYRDLLVQDEGPALELYSWRAASS